MVGGWAGGGLIDGGLRYSPVAMSMVTHTRTGAIWLASEKKVGSSSSIITQLTACSQPALLASVSQPAWGPSVY